LNTAAAQLFKIFRIQQLLTSSRYLESNSRTVVQDILIPTAAQSFKIFRIQQLLSRSRYLESNVCSTSEHIPCPTFTYIFEISKSQHLLSYSRYFRANGFSPSQDFGLNLSNRKLHPVFKEKQVNSLNMNLELLRLNLPSKFVAF